MGAARTKETRKWDEGPSGQVKGGIETLIAKVLDQIKPTEPLRLGKQASRRNIN